MSFDFAKGAIVKKRKADRGWTPDVQMADMKPAGGAPPPSDIFGPLPPPEPVQHFDYTEHTLRQAAQSSEPEGPLYRAVRYVNAAHTSGPLTPDEIFTDAHVIDTLVICDWCSAVVPNVRDYVSNHTAWHRKHGWAVTNEDRALSQSAPVVLNLTLTELCLLIAAVVHSENRSELAEVERELAEFYAARNSLRA